ncbi:HET-domain-containing protein [Xylariomycetidae sp. FL0641]|nr:HET-domain-containing protein [Xylariomycetidae sp. FL0641]
MRLINVNTLQLEEFTGPEDVEYAILSHTWDGEEVTYAEYAILSQTWDREEVTYAEYSEARPLPQTLIKRGFSKIWGACSLARKRGLNWVWVDTCCIDKSSSAELSEAINSMFRWYQTARVCFAYLSARSLEEEDADPFDVTKPHRWFTRGWALQELIAPSDVEFYDHSWEALGSKRELTPRIIEITGIDEQVLSDPEHLQMIPVARRMSWAANRKTTRVEDMAYCLLGIFDIHMPMIYGEGGKSFIRLQEEIANRNSDLSLFAWRQADSSQELRGAFAKSVDEFSGCGNLKHRVRGASLEKEFTITNKGLRIETALVNVPSASDDLVWNLGVSERDDWPLHIAGGWLGVYLTKTPNGYVRSSPEKLHECVNEVRFRCATTTIYIRRELNLSGSHILSASLFTNAVMLRTDLPSPCHILDAMPQQLWDQNRRLFLHTGQGINAYVRLKFPAVPGFSSQIIVACSTMGEPICAAWHSSHASWDVLRNYLTTTELSDYVANDYLRLHFLTNVWGTPAPSSGTMVTFRIPETGATIGVKAEIHTSPAENGALELRVEMLHLPDVATEGNDRTESMELEYARHAPERLL